MVGRNAEQTSAGRVEEEGGVARLVRGGAVVLGHDATAGQPFLRVGLSFLAFVDILLVSLGLRFTMRHRKWVGCDGLGWHEVGKR